MGLDLLFRFDAFPTEKQIAGVDNQRPGDLFLNLFQESCALGQTATRILVSAAGDNGAPFVRRIDNVQTFPLEGRQAAAGATAEQQEQTQQQTTTLLHQFSILKNKTGRQRKRKKDKTGNCPPPGGNSLLFK
ncbi:MAG: hypothetical protein JRJ56_00095 [Deltaproteobacteria bacterium]|nr:hypothetical protein [Deltaproteobacteria bacterium]